MKVKPKSIAEGVAPAIMVHGLADMCDALAPGLPVTLVSAPWAGVYAGVGWWQALMAAGRQAQPGCDFVDILDCGDATGRALEALRAGQARLCLRCGPAPWADIAQRAARQGAALLRAPPVSLDLGVPGAKRHIAAWLGGRMPG